MACNTIDTSTAPNTGDMSDCNQKPRCKWGEYEGQSLPSNPDDNCPEGYTFNSDYCKCEGQVTSDCYDGKSGIVTWTLTSQSYSWEVCTAVGCTTRCGSQSYQQCGETRQVSYSAYVSNVQCLEVRLGDPGEHCDLVNPCNAGKFVFLYNGDANVPLSYVAAEVTCGACQVISGMTLTFEEDCPDEDEVYDPDTCECVDPCPAGWSYVRTVNSSELRYYSSTACTVGGTFTGTGGSTAYPIVGRWQNVEAVPKTNSCGGAYWDVIGTRCDGSTSLITRVDCCNFGFNYKQFKFWVFLFQHLKYTYFIRY